MPIRISSSLYALALAVGIFAVPSQAKAEQFTLMDVEFTFTKEDADTSSPSKSHYYVRTDMLGAQPTDWTSPIDYRNGSVHIRTEVIDKPAGSEVTQWTLCYIPHVGIGQGYGCTGSGTYTEEGLYERNESMTSWWENTSIDWTQSIDEMHLVIKDANGGNGHAHQREDFEKFFPTTMRITMVQVSAGSTYDESLVPELQDDGTGGGAGTGGEPGTGGSDPSGGSSSTGGDSAAGGGEVAASGGVSDPGQVASGGMLEPGDGIDDDNTASAPADAAGCSIVAQNENSTARDLSLLFAALSLLCLGTVRRLGPAAKPNSAQTRNHS